MDKENNKSSFDFDNDQEFNDNFYKNIEKAFEEADVKKPEVAKDIVKASEETAETSKETAEVSQEAAEASKATAEVSQKTTEPVIETVETSKKTEESMEPKVEATTSAPTPIENGSKDNLTTNGSFEEVNKNKSEILNEETSITDTIANEMTAEEIDDELVNINSSLAQQICAEMDIDGAQKVVRAKKRLFKIQSGVILSLLCIIGFGFLLGFTKPGNKLLLGMGVNLSGTIWAAWTKDFDEGSDVVDDVDYLDDDDLSAVGEEVDPSTIVWPSHPGVGRKEAGVYNILLLGEEAIGSGTSRGRTDVIVIATMNTNDKSLKLTSLMRDTFVQIPGYKDNKLNTAYEKGGLDLLYQTIALNFDLRLDGCVMANFVNFQTIIDKIGGLNLTLTEGEAKYLNTTNYISNPEYRTVVEGTQLMNGNQILGYCRVRKRATITGNNNDYGRTDRHRIVLNAIFEKCKNKSKADLAAMMLEFLPMIKTDIDSNSFEILLNSFIDMGMSTSEIQQLRIPADGTFQDNKKVRGMSVVIPDLVANIEVLHNFIFGEDPTQTTTNAITGTVTVTPTPGVASN